MKNAPPFPKFLYNAILKFEYGEYLTPEEFIRLVDEGFIALKYPKECNYRDFLLWQLSRRFGWEEKEKRSRGAGGKRSGGA